MDIKISEVKEMIFFIEYLPKKSRVRLKKDFEHCAAGQEELKSRQNVMRKAWQQFLLRFAQRAHSYRSQKWSSLADDNSQRLKRSRFKGNTILVPARLDASKRHEILIAPRELADCLKVKHGAGKIRKDRQKKATLILQASLEDANSINQHIERHF
jgi:hypothetical protein